MGTNSVESRVKKYRPSPNAPTPISTVMARWRKARSSSQVYPASKYLNIRSDHWNSRPCRSGTFRMREQSMGVSVRAVSVEAKTVTVTVSPNSKKNRPISPPVKATGINTAARERVLAMAGKATSVVPVRAAGFDSTPASMWR